MKLFLLVMCVLWPAMAFGQAEFGSKGGVTWDENPPSEGVVMYRICFGTDLTVKDSLGCTDITQPPVEFIKHIPPLPEGTQIFVHAYAIDQAGNVSLPSTPLTISGLDFTAPGAVQGLGIQLSITLTIP